MKEKKSYEAPEMKVYQVQKANIIATSTQAGTELLQEEQYTW